MLKFTSEAENQIKSLVKNGGYSGLRLYMKKYGCSGMSYELEGINSAPQDDIKIDVNGCDFFVESSSKEFLKGCEVDYSRGIFDEGFVFNNPNHKGGCGCGKSFTF